MPTRRVSASAPQAAAIPRPGLDQLLDEPTRALAVAVKDSPALLDSLAVHEGRCRLVRELLTARLTSSAPNAPRSGSACTDAEWLTASELAADRDPAARTSSQGDDLLNAAEAAKRIGMSVGWLYKNASRLPFTRRVGPRTLRFSADRIRRYLARRDS